MKPGSIAYTEMNSGYMWWSFLHCKICFEGGKFKTVVLSNHNERMWMERACNFQMLNLIMPYCSGPERQLKHMDELLINPRCIKYPCRTHSNASYFPNDSIIDGCGQLDNCITLVNLILLKLLGNSLLDPIMPLRLN